MKIYINDKKSNSWISEIKINILKAAEYEVNLKWSYSDHVAGESDEEQNRMLQERDFIW